MLSQVDRIIRKIGVLIFFICSFVLPKVVGVELNPARDLTQF